MLRHSFFLVAAVAAGVFGAGVGVGCGDDGEATTSSGSGGGSSGTESTTGAGAGDVELTKPPARDDAAPAGDGDGAVVGLSAIYLGDTDRSGAKSPSAWQAYGYDLDGLATIDVTGDGKVQADDLQALGHCKAVQSDANAKNLEDGPGGVDNSFGRNIVSFIGSVLEDPSNTATEAIQDGSFSIGLDMETLGASADYNGVPTSLYALVGGEDGTWEKVPELLNADGSSKIVFPSAYVVANKWVSGEPQNIDLNLAIADIELALTIKAAVITVELNADRTVGSNGIIAGVLNTEDLVAEIAKIAENLAGDQEGLCPGDTLFESVVQTIRNASDIMADGSQNAGATCDGISIALGFDATAVTIGEAAEPSEGAGGASACD